MPASTIHPDDSASNVGGRRHRSHSPRDRRHPPVSTRGFDRVRGPPASSIWSHDSNSGFYQEVPLERPASAVAGAEPAVDHRYREHGAEPARGSRVSSRSGTRATAWPADGVDPRVARDQAAVGHVSHNDEKEPLLPPPSRHSRREEPEEAEFLLPSRYSESDDDEELLLPPFFHRSSRRSEAGESSHRGSSDRERAASQERGQDEVAEPRERKPKKPYRHQSVTERFARSFVRYASGQSYNKRVAEARRKK